MGVTYCNLFCCSYTLIWKQIYGWLMRSLISLVAPSGVPHQSVSGSVCSSGLTSFQLSAAQSSTGRGKNDSSGPAEPEREITRPLAFSVF